MSWGHKGISDVSVCVMFTEFPPRYGILGILESLQKPIHMHRYARSGRRVSAKI